MTTISPFQKFCNALAFLQQDQPKFELQINKNEFVGRKHDELVLLGSKMLRNLLKLAKKGEQYCMTLPPDFLDQLTRSIEEYYNLFYIPEYKGINKLKHILFQSCLKIKRKGDKYEQLLSILKAKVVSATFLPIGILVVSKAEILNVESIKYSQYGARMNDLFDIINKVNVKGNVAMRESAKKELSNCIDEVEKFVDFYCRSSQSFQMEANRRIRSLRDLIGAGKVTDSPKNMNDNNTFEQGSRQPVKAVAMTRKDLIKIQSGLQEIMNSAALISLNRAKSSLLCSDDLWKILKRERDAEAALFTQLEDEMHDNKSVEILHRLREESEIVFNDANSKLRDAGKRWHGIKMQSFPRPVAVYEEPVQANSGQTGPMLLSSNVDISKIGSKGGNIAYEAVTGVKDIVQYVASDVSKGVFGVTDTVKGVGSGAINIFTTTGAKGVANVGNRMAQHLGLDDPPPRPPINSSKSTSSLSFI